MKILLTGANGQIGTALRELAPDNVDLILTQRSVSEHLKIHYCDLADSIAVQKLLKKNQPDLIINAAAWTDVDAAEEQVEEAAILNVGLPTQLANYAAKQCIPLVHYSSDYVYSGKRKKPWLETDINQPQNNYGNTKLVADQVIVDSGCDYLILRTSWVYGGPSKNFLTTIANKLIAGDDLQVVDDQIGCPTWSVDIARCTWQALAAWLVTNGNSSFESGLYHLTGKDSGSWYDFACQIRTALINMNQTNVEETKVDKCHTKDFPRRAVRPMYTVLNSHAFLNQYNCQPQGWAAVENCLKQLYR